MGRNYQQRCHNHDYCSRCIYLLTIMKAKNLPPFVRIDQDPNFTKETPKVTVYPLGRLLYDSMDAFFSFDKRMSVMRRVVMPDHIHLCVFVKERLEDHLGCVVAAFTKYCGSVLQAALQEGCGIHKHDYNYWAYFDIRYNVKYPYSMFQHGFNDKICFNRGAKENYINYINDNPRRYLVKKLHPDYFENKLDLILGERRLALYGNFFLLDNPDKAAVKISRRKELTPNLDWKIEVWEETIRCGGVLVSPFINREEKKYMDAAIDGNADGVILLVNYAFPERFKPRRQLFDLSREGRLLMVSTSRHAEPDVAMTRAEALELNAIAKQISALKCGEMRLSSRRS